MRSGKLTPPMRRATLASLAALGLLGNRSFAQDGQRYTQTPQVAQSPQSPQNYSVIPGQPLPLAPSTTTSPYSTGAPYGVPGPGQGYPSAPPAQPPAPAPTSLPSSVPSSLFDDTGAGSGYGAALAGGGFGSTGAGGTVAIAGSAGYIDSAIIRTNFRLRYESAYDMNSPDRAEFFYPKCGCFGNPANFSTLIPGSGTNPRNSNYIYNPVQAHAAGFDPRATGPQHFGKPGAGGGESRIDYQQVAPYFELALRQTDSIFVEVPARFLNPQLNANTYGFSDMQLGWKHAFVANPDQFYTFQFRSYLPTGSGQKGLGTNHVSLEPALLVFQRLTDRVYFVGEFRDWIPVHGSDFAGNVLRYGAGLFYNAVLTDSVRIAPVFETVGWTCLSGKRLALTSNDPVNGPTFGPVSAAGDTIVNIKAGIRMGLGNYTQAGGGSALNDRHSVYVGYGQAVTGDHWYEQIVRAEYNYWF